MGEERQSTDHNDRPIISSKGVGEQGGVRDYGGDGSIHQSISNEGKNWSSQADGNPALPEVVFLHCLSAGDRLPAAALCNGAPTGQRLQLHRVSDTQIFTNATFSALVLRSNPRFAFFKYVTHHREQI